MTQVRSVAPPYRLGTASRIVQGLLYGGGLGQWSWLLHRVTGLGIALFLVIHIIDTFFAVAYPALYDHTVAIYGGIWGDAYYWPLRWAFRLGELGLIASVLFHAINGLRVILIDLAPRTLRYQKEMAWTVLAIFVLAMAPIAVIVVLPLAKTPGASWRVPPEGPGGTNRDVQSGGLGAARPIEHAVGQATTSTRPPDDGG